MEEGRNPNGLVSLGQRIQMLEKRLKRQEKELKRRSCGEEDHYIRLINKKVSIQRKGKTREATLKEVGRYTILVEDDNGSHILNKTQIDEISPVRV